MSILIQLLMAVLWGVMAVFAMPPVSMLGNIFIALGGFYWQLQRLESNKVWLSFWCGWAFGFGYHVVGLYWIGNALLVSSNPYAWAYPLAVAGLPALLAFFTAIPAGLYKKFSGKINLADALGFVGLLALFEWLRGHVLTGFPWNLYGYAWTDFLEIAQTASIIGIYGLTLATILASVLAGYAVITKSFYGRVISLSFVVGLLVAGYTYGAYTVSTPQYSKQSPITIVAIQPNIAQDKRWGGENVVNNIRSYIALSKKAIQYEHRVLVVWPETAIPFFYIKDLPYIAQEVLGKRQYSYLITGALMKNEDGSYGNSIIVVDANGEVVSRYDKSHLVPFGEYIPFQKYLSFIPIKSLAEFQGMRPGENLSAQVVDNSIINAINERVPAFLPAVCYEIIFPNRMQEESAGTPEFILTVTNDGWYGNSWGPYQHFAQARFRAIESGLPVIRSANRGVSAIIDSHGRVISATSITEPEVAKAILPAPRPGIEKSFYFHNLLFIAICIALITLPIFMGRIFRIK